MWESVSAAIMFDMDDAADRVRRPGVSHWVRARGADADAEWDTLDARMRRLEMAPRAGGIVEIEDAGRAPGCTVLRAVAACVDAVVRSLRSLDYRDPLVTEVEDAVAAEYADDEGLDPTDVVLWVEEMGARTHVARDAERAGVLVTRTHTRAEDSMLYAVFLAALRRGKSGPPLVLLAHLLAQGPEKPVVRGIRGEDRFHEQLDIGQTFDMLWCDD